MKAVSLRLLAAVVAIVLCFGAPARAETTFGPPPLGFGVVDMKNVGCPELQTTLDLLSFVLTENPTPEEFRVEMVDRGCKFWQGKTSAYVFEIHDLGLLDMPYGSTSHLWVLDIEFPAARNWILWETSVQEPEEEPPLPEAI